MSQNRKNKRVEVITETTAPGHPIRRFVMTMCLLAGVLYVGAYFACKTDGFRSYTEEFLEHHLGIPVHVKAVRATPSLDLVVTGVRTRDGNRQGTPGYQVQETVVRWSALNKLLSHGEILSSLELKDCSVSFAPGEAGEWEPAALAKLGSWLAEWGRFNLKEQPASSSLDSKDTKLSPNIQADFWNRIRISIENGDMSWWNVDQRELASAAGIRFYMTPLFLPNRKMTHYFLTLENAKIGDQKTVRNFTLEMLKLESNNIVLTCVGEWGAAGGDDRRVTSE
jgi:hypothetical protein